MDIKRPVVGISIVVVIILFCVVCYVVLVVLHGSVGAKSHAAGPATAQGIDFKSFMQSKERLPQKKAEVSIAFVGDIMLSRDTAKQIKGHGDINYPFLKIRDYLHTADIVCGNLESPITPGPLIQRNETTFRADPGIETALKAAGISVVSLANNHIKDFGWRGLQDTIRHLDKVGIRHNGADVNKDSISRPVYIKKNGTRIAFLSFVDQRLIPLPHNAISTGMGLATMDTGNMASAVRKAKRKADFVIVSMHAGDEYCGEPNCLQVNFAHAAINAGADMVIGHHPHVIQRIERYKGKYIFCSLGNFIFDQMWSQATKEGLVAKVVLSKEAIDRIELQPITIENFAQPMMTEGRDAMEIVKRLKMPLGKRIMLTWDHVAKTVRVRYRSVIYAGAGKQAFKSTKSITADVDGDARQEYCHLSNGRLQIFRNNKLIWKSKPSWWIDDFALADSNGDGIIDINMAVWKSGSFGTTRPFWIKENDWSVKNHFFVFDVIKGHIKPVWQSSNLDEPNREFCFSDIDGDGKLELITLEAKYGDEYRAAKYVAIWKWNGWGFFNVWRSHAGAFQDLSIERGNGIESIIISSLDASQRP